MGVARDTIWYRGFFITYSWYYFCMSMNIFIFICSLLAVMKGASLSTTYAIRLAEGFHISKYTVGFLIVAVISILPETFISINAALTGVPSFALGVLFGSNIADLTLVFALIILFSRRTIRIESKILRHHSLYPFILVLPLILGFDGGLTRLEGVTLIFVGLVFYYLSFKNGTRDATSQHPIHGRTKNILMLLAGMGVLLIGSYYTVASATTLATSIGVSPVLIGMLIVGLGTTMPEFFFSLKSLHKHDDSLAIGDILGTVLADATIVVGILAVIAPFSFPKEIIYIAGIFMVASAFILFSLMRSGRMLTQKEAFALFVLWLAFILTELTVGTI